MELFTLNRAWTELSDDEFFWEPLAGSWSVRRKADCQTLTPFGSGDWVADFDADVARAADVGKAMAPQTTIAWLMWHVASMPELDFLGGT